jgi:hypothetical protein
VRYVVGSVIPGQTGSFHGTSVLFSILFHQGFIYIFHSPTTNTVCIILATDIVANTNISVLTVSTVYRTHWATGRTAEEAPHISRREEEIPFSKASIPDLGPKQPLCIMGTGAFLPKGTSGS